MTAVITRPNVNEILAGSKSIYVSGFSAEIEKAPALFHDARPRNATVTGLFSPLVNHQSYADAEIGLRVRSFFLTKALKQNLATGLVDYCPWRYGRVDRWLAESGRFDTALVMLTPPDERGHCSLGVQVDFLPSFIGKIENVVGFINPQMPRTLGDTQVNYRSLTAVVDYAEPLLNLAQRPPDQTTVNIARTIIDLIPDGATVQFGIGQVPSQVLAGLVGHRGLCIHSGVIDDNILALEASGALDRDKPIVTGTAVGGKDFYDVLGDSRFLFRAVAYTHAYTTIASIRRFIAVNSVLQIDLLGQVSAEGSGGRLVASPGGQPDFARGALDSEGGASIVSVRARRAGEHSGGIVPLLDSPCLVTSGGVDVDIVVSEFGAASVRNLSMDGRAEAIIAIAAPEDQEHLTREWVRIRRDLFRRSAQRTSPN